MMTHRSSRHVVLATVTVVAMTTPAWAGKPLTGIPLVWKPTELSNLAVVDLSGISDVKIQREPFVDNRPDKGKIGENQEDRVPKPVTTSASVADFVALYLEATLRHIGFSVVEQGGDVTLGGEILYLMVTETNTYNGQVRIKISLKRNGRTEWTGTTSGSSKRFGRSYKAENYYETISDALVHAAENLANDEGFRKALAK